MVVWVVLCSYYRTIQASLKVYSSSLKPLIFGILQLSLVFRRLLTYPKIYMHMGDIRGDVLFGLMEIPPVKLNIRQVDTAKPKDKPYKLSDGGDFTFWSTLMENAIGHLSTVLPVRRSCLLLGFIPT